MTYLFLKVLVVVLMTAAAVCSQSAALDAEAIYAKGVSLLESGKVPAAVDHFQQTVSLDRNSSKYQYALALSCYKAGRYDDALAAFTRFAELKPGAVAFNQIGVTLVELHRYREAREQYEKALKFAPDDPTVLQNAGMTSVSLGEFKDAVSFLERARALGKNNPELAANLGYAYAGRKEYKKALAEFQRLEKDWPHDPGVKFALAAMYLATGDRNNAASQQKEVANLDPELGRKLQRAMFADKLISVEDMAIKRQ